jgi:hypothetical protein
MKGSSYLVAAKSSRDCCLSSSVNLRRAARNQQRNILAERSRTLLWLAPFAQRVGPTENACSLFRFVAAESVRRCTHKFNPICRRFLSGSALGAKFEVVVCVVSTIEVSLRHHRVAFQTKMFVSHRRSPQN